MKALGAVIGNCKHLSRIELKGGVDCLCYLLEQVRNPGKCSLTIDSSDFDSRLTSVGAVQLASLLPRFNTVIALNLDLRDCWAGALDTLVPSITHKTLERLILEGIILTPAVTKALGQSLPRMSSLQVLKLSGVNGSILPAEGMETLFRRFNKTMPLLKRLTFSDFNLRGCLAPLIKSLPFPNLRKLKLERIKIDEHEQCSLLKSFGTLTGLEMLILRETSLTGVHYFTQWNKKTTLQLDVISLTPAVAATLERVLPEMSSPQELELTGVDGSILQAAEIEALFGGFNKTMPLLKKLTFSDFNVRGCLAPLMKSLPFFPNLRELKLGELNIDEHDQCSLLKSFGFLTTRKVHVHEGTYLDSFHYFTEWNNKTTLQLDVISLTPTLAAMLRRVLPEMSSLQELELTGEDGSILQAAEMEALFGGFDKTMPLRKLIFTGFNVRGRLAPLFKSLRFFPNLVELGLHDLNMDEHDLRGLLERFQFIPNLQYLTLSSNPLGHAVTSIVPHVINLKTLWIDNTNHSEEDLNYVRDTVQQALPELEIITNDEFSDFEDEDLLDLIE